ncbi:low affinity iron permease family protein [Phytomonospora sp. NPDC050363]|uniref:low affinity iron permease family protein n=1 Tax=Phytomonospora sp. NPDC050363 TaxID=3155642 RepID=UPI0033FA2807
MTTSSPEANPPFPTLHAQPLADGGKEEPARRSSPKASRAGKPKVKVTVKNAGPLRTVGAFVGLAAWLTAAVVAGFSRAWPTVLLSAAGMITLVMVVLNQRATVREQRRIAAQVERLLRDEG